MVFTDNVYKVKKILFFLVIFAVEF